MKSNGKKVAKSSASRNGRPKTVGKKATVTSSGKSTAKSPAKKKRGGLKSPLPARFRSLKQLSAAKDPLFWDLRREFKDYYRSLPEEKAEAFLDGLSGEYLGYLVMELIHEGSTAPGIFWGDS